MVRVLVCGAGTAGEVAIGVGEVATKSTGAGEGVTTTRESCDWMVGGLTESVRGTGGAVLTDSIGAANATGGVTRAAAGGGCSAAGARVLEAVTALRAVSKDGLAVGASTRCESRRLISGSGAADESSEASVEGGSET